MGLFDGLGGGSPSDPSSGLMGMYANPQTAALLGMSQGILSAAGPSRIPVTMGQAMGAGMQGMQQNAGNALQMQQQMLRMRAMQGLMGDPSQQQPPQPQPSQQPNPTMAQGAPVTGGANTGAMSGPSAGMGLMAPQMPPQQPAPAAQGAPQASGAIYGKTPQQLFQQGMLMNMAGMQGGGDLMRIAVEHDPSLAMQMPTDVQKNAAAAYGQGTPAYTNALQATVNKGGTVTGRAGGYLQGPNGTTWLPNVPAGGMPVMGPNGPTGAVTAQPGAADITSNMAYAKAAGEGGALPFSGVDAQGNPLPITNRTAAATQGGTTLPLRNNNPGAVSPGGQVASYPDMATGMKAMDNNLASYASDPKAATIGGAITKWVGSPPNAPAYIADVTSRLGIPASTPFDATNPAQRQALSTAIMLHENGAKVVFGVGQQQGNAAPAGAQGGAIYAAPPMGAKNAADTSQGAPSQLMKDSYGSLSTSDASYQQSREALNEMINLAQNKGASGTAIGLLPESVGTKISPDAATYQKLHATYVALQGKALGGGGTDASRATIDEAVPTYDKPQSAMVGGLTTQLNNLDLSHVKTQFLMPIYQAGNEKAYTQQSAAFDQNIKPSMVPILTTSGDAQRAAVQAAVKANPALRSNFEWAFNNGLLK